MDDFEDLNFIEESLDFMDSITAQTWEDDLEYDCEEELFPEGLGDNFSELDFSDF